MKTPICDFVRAYAERDPVRMHMPGHKGRALTGPELLDLTEIEGADVLYRSRGVIRESEENAASLFGAARTVYSAEGSSLCIRAMLYLALLTAKQNGLPARLLAGRNAHRTLMTAAALLDLDVDWLYPKDKSGYLSCNLSAEDISEFLEKTTEKPAAVYLTNPDYLGNLVDIASIANMCHQNDVLLMVDNAHGAYLKFLPQSQHPMDLGADLCCSSAHKTLPVLTGGAYLHISEAAPFIFAEQADNALMMFGSTSPSYLILQSLDAANAYLADGYRRRLEAFVAQVGKLKEVLTAYGYTLRGDEPLKLTIFAKPYGYTGNDLAGKKRRR